MQTVLTLVTTNIDYFLQPLGTFLEENCQAPFTFFVSSPLQGTFLKVFSWGYRYAQHNGKLEGVKVRIG